MQYLCEECAESATEQSLGFFTLFRLEPKEPYTILMSFFSYSKYFSSKQY